MFNFISSFFAYCAEGRLRKERLDLLSGLADGRKVSVRLLAKKMNLSGRNTSKAKKDVVKIIRDFGFSVETTHNPAHIRIVGA